MEQALQPLTRPSALLIPKFHRRPSIFVEGRVWFLCPVYSARSDRQPRCTLQSASLSEAADPATEIPPPPDDRAIGSGEPSLGFPSSHECVLLANKRLWLYDFSNRSFRQMDLPETPQHIRWFEFPGQPKFSADAMFAAVPVYLFHYPMFQEGQVSHGTKLLIVDLERLQILKTIQPPGKQSVISRCVMAVAVLLWLQAGVEIGRASISLQAWVPNRV